MVIRQSVPGVIARMLGGLLGDIYYFRASSSQGYSEPHFDTAAGGITVVYMRLADSSPCLRVEVPGRLDPRRR